MNKKNCHYSSGFTLVEILIVITLFAFVGVIATTVLVTSLRTATKTNFVNAVKENGNFAMTEMSNAIRYAKNVQCANAAPFTTITVTATDSSQLVFDCNNGSINENGSPLTDTNTVAVVANSCNITCTQQNLTENPVVQISFSLKHNTSSNLPEQISSPIQFTTSIFVRNINR